MKFSILGIVFLLSALSGAGAKAQDLNFQQYRKFLMQGKTANSGKKWAIQTTCTNSEGQVYRIGEKGYDACLNKLSPTPGAGSSTIHFGN